MGETVFGIAAARDQRHHLVADLALGDAFAERDHFAGNFKARKIARAGRHRIQSHALQHVGTIDACGFNLDENFIRSRLRHRPLFRHEHLGSAGLEIAMAVICAGSLSMMCPCGGWAGKKRCQAITQL